MTRQKTGYTPDPGAAVVLCEKRRRKRGNPSGGLAGRPLVETSVDPLIPIYVFHCRSVYLKLRFRCVACCVVATQAFPSSPGDTPGGGRVLLARGRRLHQTAHSKEGAQADSRGVHCSILQHDTHLLITVVLALFWGAGRCV